MSIYIIDLALLRTKLHMLQDDLNIGSKLVYPDAMEARFCFEKDINKEYEDTISNYQAWNQFVTNDHGEGVDELVFPQSSES